MPRAVDTPRAGRGGLAAKEGRGWREREIVPTVRGVKTRRRKSPGGARSGWDPKQVPLVTALAAGSKALKPGASELARVKPQALAPNDRRA